MRAHDEPLLTVDAHGQVVGWSVAAERLFGRTAAHVLGSSVFEVVGSLARGRAWRIVPLVEEPRERTWGVWQDKDEGSAGGGNEDLLGLGEAILDAVFTQADVGLHFLDPQLRVLRVNPSAIGMRGISVENVIGLPAVEAYASIGLRIDEGMLREVLDSGRPARDVLLRGRPAADPEREHVFSVSVYRVRNGAGRALGLVATTVDVTARERAQARLRLLHRARELIGRTLDVERTARELVDVTVPGFADSAVVALTDAVLQGKAPELAAVDGEMLLRCAAAGSTRADCPPPPTGSTLLPALFGPKLPSSVAILPAEGAHSGRTPYGPRLVAPLSARGQVFGAVAFERLRGGEPFTPGDVDLAKSITTRTASSLENALRFTREHIVMTALQSWPIGQERQTQRAAEIAQRHRPGGSGAGSWFDALPLPGARVALVVGQVERPGLSAVATMSRLRTAVQALTTLDLDPHELLARLHSTVLRLDREQKSVQGSIDEPTVHCTIAVHDPVSGRLDAARAGRSLFAIVRPDGTMDADPLSMGPLLGGDGPPFASTSLVLPEGSTVCLASPAATREQGPTRRGLAAALAHPHHGPQQMADDVQHLLAPDRVLLVARTRRLPPDEVAQWDVPPELRSAGPAREQTQTRLQEWGLDIAPFTAALVVSELVTNAIRYGAPPITLRLIRGETTLTCEIDDAALAAPYPRHAKATDEGGRGLYICATLAKSWGVRYREDGKTVWAELDSRTTGPDAG
ncbi:SpoIIE family protein phosphatase [Streptomyces sp. NBC_00269]|uniref:SpoIIE family protein phosphatase n=1 Tax=Streptomyces sp. NBC_00269 TaxID=2975696 RepID=UPI002E293156|nr:SpoIIE family protein phosphatase [Streptomyces sp. NBC_00269]